MTKKTKKQIYPSEERGDTWVGVRPIIFKDKRKYDRKKAKQEMVHKEKEGFLL